MANFLTPRILLQYRSWGKKNFGCLQRQGENPFHDELWETLHSKPVELHCMYIMPADNSADSTASSQLQMISRFCLHHVRSVFCRHNIWTHLPYVTLIRTHVHAHKRMRAQPTSPTDERQTLETRKKKKRGKKKQYLCSQFVLRYCR